MSPQTLAATEVPTGETCPTCDAEIVLRGGDEPGAIQLLCGCGSVAALT